MEIGGRFGKCVLFDAISRDSVLSSLSLSLLAVIHVFTSEMQSCMLWTEASMVQLSVVCKRLVGDEVLSNECSKRFCIQDEQNGSKDGPLWNAKVEHGWL